jgi:hypothetical protein
MDRFTISLDERLAEAFDKLIWDRGYARSEARRFAIFCANICRIARRGAIRRAPVSPIYPTFTIIMNGNCPSA